MSNTDKRLFSSMYEELKKEYETEAIYDSIIQKKERLIKTLNDDQKIILQSIFDLFDLYCKISYEDAFYEGVLDALKNNGNEDYMHFLNKTGPYENLNKE